MEKRRKRQFVKPITIIVLIVCILSSWAMPFIEPIEVRAAETQVSLEDLQKKFPGGKYWNHRTLNGHDINEQTLVHYGPCNNPDGYTSTPCTDHRVDIRGEGYYDCNSYGGALQCYGFVKKLSMDAYGAMFSIDSWPRTSIYNAKAGDIIHFNTGDTYGHWAMITGKIGTTVTLGECNYDYQCRIDWGREYPCVVSDDSDKIYQIYAAPRELPITSNSIGSSIPGGSRIIPDGDYQIEAGVGNGQYLTVEGYSAANGANVQLWRDPGHIFHVEWLGENEGYKITYKNSGLSLTVDGEDKRLAGRSVDQWVWYNNEGQKWVINDTGNGQYYTIQARCSGFYLDVADGKNEDGTNIQMWEGNGSNAQKWKFVPYNPIVSGGYRTISDGDYYIVSALEGDQYNPGQRCLTIGGLPGAKNTRSANAELWKVFGDQDHVFTVIWLENGFYQIKLRNSDTQCLDVTGGSLSRGTNVQQYDIHGGDSQQWRINETDDGTAYMIQAKSNGWYMDVAGASGAADGSNILLWEGHGGNNQKWFFVPWSGVNSTKQEIPDGEYQIVSKLDNNKALNVGGNGTTDKTNVVLWPCVGDERHTFNVWWLGDGYYEIVNKNSDLALEVQDGLCKGGANVQLCTQRDCYCQKWIIRSCGDGYFNIISKCNGLYLDITDANTDDGTNIQMCVGWGRTGADCQQWKFIPWDSTPQIQTPPSASEITYGQTLADSILSGGVANTPGSFVWKDGAIRPSCLDSNQTEYTVIFTPTNTDSWKSTETKVTIKVNPAPNPPNLPNRKMSVTSSSKTVGDISLPAGWQWQQADRDMVLKAGTSVTAEAIYMGADKGNYLNERVSISIAVSDCSHPQNRQETRNAAEATCEKDGYTGDKYCAECQSIIESGHSIPALGHAYHMEMVKEPTKDQEGERLYTCIRCKDTYTEAVPFGIFYQITLEASEGGSVVGAGKYLEGESATVTAVPDRGYRFVKWVEQTTEDASIVKERTVKFASANNATRQSESEDGTVTAKTTPSNAARKVSETEEEKTVAALVKSSIQKFSKQRTSEYIVSTDTRYTFTVTRDRSLMAVFEKVPTSAPSAKEYTITFQTSGGTISQASVVTQNGRLTNLPTPVRNGYSFKGWFTKADGSSQITLHTVFTEDSVIYAQWVKIDNPSNTGGNEEGNGNSGSDGNTGSGDNNNTSSSSGTIPGGNTGSGSGSGGSSGGGGGSSSGGSSGGGGGSSSGGGGGGGGGSSKKSSGSGPSQSPGPNSTSLPSYVVKGTWTKAEDGTWHFIDSSGMTYVNAWAAVENPYADLSAGQQAFDWFCFDENGNMRVGWYYAASEGFWYYLNPISDNTLGRMITGWLLIEGKYYYFNEISDGHRGRMYQNEITPEGYKVDANGVWVESK